MTTTRPRVSIVDCGSSKVPDIARVLKEVGAVPCVMYPHQLADIVADLPAAIVISGNPTLICETGTGFLADFEVLCTLKLPVLGICFGHQVIGMLYGAEVTVGKEDRDLRHIEILQTTSLFNGISSKKVFQQDHIEEVAVPQDFIHLATSSHCFNEAMMHRERPVYGVQFHPEISGNAGKQLLANFLSLIEKREQHF